MFSSSSAVLGIAGDQFGPSSIIIVIIIIIIPAQIINLHF